MRGIGQKGIEDGFLLVVTSLEERGTMCSYVKSEFRHLGLPSLLFSDAETYFWGSF